ncbi:hypothetical protein CJ030_MR8G028451 [Morella rubra]|uniref:Uncharacterized protein n=1 Tax=Morella rubra TaxID=262757 RepID=A0A6A1UTX7_9ROSI|nr:hypothetical protein CJ030_MR8G028451 [Morella rubra]
MEENHSSSKSEGVHEKILTAVSVCPVYRTIRRMSIRKQDPRTPSPAPNPAPAIGTPSVRTIDIQTEAAGPGHPKSAEGSQRLEAVEVPIKFDYSRVHSANAKRKPATQSLPIQASSLGTKVASVKEETNKPELISLQGTQRLKEQNNNGLGVKATSKVEEKVKPKLEVPGKAVTSVEGKLHDSNAVPQVGKEGEVPEQDINDTFSDYIKRVRMKMVKTVSNIGGGKKATGQGDGRDKKKTDEFSEYINRAKRKIRTTSSIGGGKILTFKRE